MTCEIREGNTPVFFVSDVHELQGQDLACPKWEGNACHLSALNSTTNPLTATALIYAFGAGITAGAGTRLVLQLLLDFGWL